jgi:FixJ family two-component response regulator
MLRRIGRSRCPSEGTVFVVDDDVSVRDALAASISSAGWEAVTFETATAFLNRRPSAGASCLVLDVSLPDLNGLDLQAQIAGDRIEMQVIFITGYADVPMTVRAMKAGAIEVLTKPFDDAALLGAVAAALARSRDALHQQAPIRLHRERYGSLSAREREVMAMLIAGLLNKQIAWRLGISKITVKAHRGRVMQKMQVRSLAELVTISAGLNKNSIPLTYCFMNTACSPPL